MEIDKAIKERKSVRKFLSKKPDWRNIITAIDYARYAPMAGNIFSLKFILVDDKEKIKKLAEASQQNFVSQAHYAVVVCSNPSMTKNSYEEKAEMFLHQQAGAGIENFILKLADFGLSTCWVGYFVEEQIKEILNIPENIQVEAFFPIGYEDKKRDLRKRIKPNLDSMLYFNKYGKKRMNE